MVDVTKVSTKGQVVIPQHIREELNLEEGSQVVISRMKDFVVMKKISITDLKKEFEELTKIGEKRAKKLGIYSEEDVVRIIHEGRKKRH
ncbi:MAG: AbrB/MazE/SpoVT family DNA-binding domain-containing protein [bacterium]|nr:AbrB/MazE/SpoVT family DNA-binding domain-containing protein [bacterium]